MANCGDCLMHHVEIVILESDGSCKCCKSGHKLAHDREVVERYTITDDDRNFFIEHYSAIANRLAAKRLWRNPWRVEIRGCVFNFTAKGYPRRGSAIWKEQEDELNSLLRKDETE